MILLGFVDHLALGFPAPQRARRYGRPLGAVTREMEGPRKAGKESVRFE